MKSTLLPLAICFAACCYSQAYSVAAELENSPDDVVILRELRYRDGRPVAVETVVISTQHADSVGQDRIREDIIEKVILPVVPSAFLDLGKALYQVDHDDDLRVTVLEEGGHIAEILDKRSGINPLWTPPWPSGSTATILVCGR